MGNIVKVRVIDAFDLPNGILKKGEIYHMVDNGKYYGYGVFNFLRSRFEVIAENTEDIDSNTVEALRSLVEEFIRNSSSFPGDNELAFKIGEAFAKLEGNVK